MTRKLVSVCAIFAIALSANLAQAQVAKTVVPGKRILPLKRYMVIYWSPTKKKCFRGKFAHLRARAFMARVRSVGGIAKMKCFSLRSLPPIRVCCVTYKVPRKVRVFWSFIAAAKFRAKLNALGIRSFLRPLPFGPPIPRPIPMPRPLPLPGPLGN